MRKYTILMSILVICSVLGTAFMGISIHQTADDVVVWENTYSQGDRAAIGDVSFQLKNCLGTHMSWDTVIKGSDLSSKTEYQYTLKERDFDSSGDYVDITIGVDDDLISEKQDAWLVEQVKKDPKADAYYWYPREHGKNYFDFYYHSNKQEVDVTKKVSDALTKYFSMPLPDDYYKKYEDLDLSWKGKNPVLYGYAMEVNNPCNMYVNTYQGETKAYFTVLIDEEDASQIESLFQNTPGGYGIYSISCDKEGNTDIETIYSFPEHMVAYDFCISRDGKDLFVFYRDASDLGAGSDTYLGQESVEIDGIMVIDAATGKERCRFGLSDGAGPSWYYIGEGIFVAGIETCMITEDGENVYYEDIYVYTKKEDGTYERVLQTQCDADVMHPWYKTYGRYEVIDARYENGMLYLLYGEDNNRTRGTVALSVYGDDGLVYYGEYYTSLQPSLRNDNYCDLVRKYGVKLLFP